MPDVQGFVKWILKISDGVVYMDNDRQANVEILKHILIKDVCDPIKEIIDFLYPSFLLELESAETRIHFHQHAILEPKNEVDKIIEYMLNQMLGDS